MKKATAKSLKELFTIADRILMLAALMLWQTTPGYLAKNKKEQAILKEYKKRAQEAATKK